MSGRTHVAGVILNKDNTAIMTGTDGFYNGGLLIGWRITHYIGNDSYFLSLLFILFSFSAFHCCKPVCNLSNILQLNGGFLLWKEQFIR